MGTTTIQALRDRIVAAKQETRVGQNTKTRTFQIIEDLMDTVQSLIDTNALNDASVEELTALSNTLGYKLGGLIDLEGKSWTNPSHFNSYAPGIYLVRTTNTTTNAPTGLPTGNPLSYAVIITGAGATIRGEIVPLVAGQHKVYRWDVNGNTILQVVTSDMLSAAVALLNETKFAKGTGAITDWKAAGNFNNWESGSYIVGANNQTALNVPAGLSTADAYYAVLLYGVGTEQKGFIAELWQDGATYVWNVKANTADKIAKDAEVKALEATIYPMTFYYKKQSAADGTEYLEIEVNSAVSQTLNITGGVFVVGGTTPTSIQINVGSNIFKVRATSNICSISFDRISSYWNRTTSGNAPIMFNSLRKIPPGFTRIEAAVGILNELSLRVSDLPHTITKIGGSVRLEGYVSNLPNSITSIGCTYGSNDKVSGDIAYFPQGLTYIGLLGSGVSGDISKLPPGVTFVELALGSGTFTYNTSIGGRIWAANMSRLFVSGASALTANMLNSLLYDLAQTSWSGGSSVNLRGTQDASTPALIASLQSKGVTVTINS